MRFGGHETFAIREGWLHKGLKLLIESPHLLTDDHAADWLGVGRNMAKSIRHWLLATGLATTSGKRGSRATNHLKVTAFGVLIYDHDPYFSDDSTWWALHIHLIHSPDYATTWGWFFNHFNLNRFEKSVCMETLHRYLQQFKRREPTLNTLQRDLACLLQSYAQPIPTGQDDPEEARDCPFMELGLLSYFRTSGSYQLHQGVKEIPMPLLGYAVSLVTPESQDNTGMIEMTFHEAARQPLGPGRVFALTAEALFEVVLKLEGEALAGDLQIAGLASERLLRIRRKRPLDWLKDYYVERENQYAA